MKTNKEESGKINKKKAEPKTKKTPVEKYEDVQKLVYLLQVHQVELEHQNEELRITHQELEVSRNNYVNLFDFSPIPYFTLDKNGIIKEVNLSAGKMLGVDRNKLINRNFFNYIPLDEKDVFHLFLKTVFDSSVKQSCELKITGKDKRVFQVLLEGLKLDELMESEFKCQVALIDLTEYKNIEDSLKESNKKLKELNSTKDKFFSIIAHDLKGPFQSLLSFSEILATEIKTLSKDEIVVFSKGLNEDLKKLYGLLDNLLYWSLMQRDKLEFKPEDIDLYSMVNKAAEILNPSILKKDISISNKINPGTFAYADVDMLRLVFQNLISNAIKFTKRDGKVSVSSVERNNFIEVTVLDTGIGIEPWKAAELFSITKVSSSNGTEGEQGTGLGLPLCKEFVERNGGKIWVESEPGKGSKFIFTLQKSNPQQA